MVYKFNHEKEAQDDNSFTIWLDKERKKLNKLYYFIIMLVPE